MRENEGLTATMRVAASVMTIPSEAVLNTSAARRSLSSARLCSLMSVMKAKAYDGLPSSPCTVVALARTGTLRPSFAFKAIS